MLTRDQAVEIAWAILEENEWDVNQAVHGETTVLKILVEGRVVATWRITNNGGILERRQTLSNSWELLTDAQKENLNLSWGRFIRECADKVELLRFKNGQTTRTWGTLRPTKEPAPDTSTFYVTDTPSAFEERLRDFVHAYSGDGVISAEYSVWRQPDTPTLMHLDGQGWNILLTEDNGDSSHAALIWITPEHDGQLRVTIPQPTRLGYPFARKFETYCQTLENPMPDRPQLKVFISYASQDKDVVRDLYERLTRDGIAPWLDKEKLLPGQDWKLEITKAVRASDVVLVCLSQHAINKRGYVQKEMRLALDVAEEQPEGAIFLIPVRLEACDVPERLKVYQWVDLYQADGYERLLRALAARARELGVSEPGKEGAPTRVEAPVAGDSARLSFTEVKRRALIQRRDGLLEEYQAVSNQLGYALEASQRVRLQRQADSVEKEIRSVEAELVQLEE